MISFPLLSIIYVSITMFRVFRKVRDVEVNAMRYSFIALHRGYDKKKTTKISRRVMIQGILYSVAMILTWIFSILSIIVFLTTKQTNQVIRYFATIFNPLQGLFNLLIYLMSNFCKMLKECSRRNRTMSLTEDVQQKDQEEENNTESVMFPCKLPSSGKTRAKVTFSDESSARNNTILPGNHNLDSTDEEEKEEEKKETESFSLSRFSTNNNNENDLDIGKHLHVNQNNNENDNNSYYNDNGQC
mmetsp:Transcript_24856/g.37145  ORF Transcript_24856/g.37145 Transcript_24856/m.37145 type:complete len:244 (-) Transcript_24856:173-904(-)